MRKIPLNNESEMMRWDEFMKSHLNGSPFHLANWMKTIEETYFFEPVLYVYKNENHNIGGVFPFSLIKTPLIGSRMVSLPFSDYCGPLCNDPMHKGELLARVIEEYKEQVKYIEVRSKILNSSGFLCYNFYKCHLHDLPSDSAELMKMIGRRTARYSIRKAEKSGIEINQSGEELLEEDCPA